MSDGHANGLINDAPKYRVSSQQVPKADKVSLKNPPVTVPEREVHGGATFGWIPDSHLEAITWTNTTVADPGINSTDDH